MGKNAMYKNTLRLYFYLSSPIEILFARTKFIIMV